MTKLNSNTMMKPRATYRNQNQKIQTICGLDSFNACACDSALFGEGAVMTVSSLYGSVDVVEEGSEKRTDKGSEKGLCMSRTYTCGCSYFPCECV